MEEIFKRRSIRSYNDKEISEDIINDMLKAAMNAPSAMNKKAWEFIVIDDKKILSELSKTTEYSFMLEKANKAIIVIGKEETEYWQQDLAAATQNILLSATSYNVGSCWIGVAPKKEKEDYVRNLLRIPNELRIFSIISLGYTDKTKDKNELFNKYIIHFNQY